MSDFFGATTDYLLKGIAPVERQEQDGRRLAGRVLYLASTAFIFIDLLCAFGGWHETQRMDAVWGSVIVQAVGVAGYFIGRLLSEEPAPFYVNWLNVAGISFMPVSLLTGACSILVFHQGRIAPYPIGIPHPFLFCLAYAAILIISYILLKRGARKG